MNNPGNNGDNNGGNNGGKGNATDPIVIPTPDPRDLQPLTEGVDPNKK